jgi:hypothetical protein
MLTTSKTIISGKQKVFKILSKLKKCNNIVNDLLIYRNSIEKIKIKSNGSWLDTIFIYPKPGSENIFVIFANSWNADEIHWYKRKGSRTELVNAKNLINPRPNNTWLRIWWD